MQGRIHRRCGLLPPLEFAAQFGQRLLRLFIERFLHFRPLEVQPFRCRVEPLVDLLLLILDRLLADFERIDFSRWNDRKILPLGVPEYAGDGVVVLGRNGVEFVIVAARTGDGESQETSGKRVDAIGERLGLGLGLSLGITAIAHVGRTDGEKSRAGRVRLFCQKIPGDLLGEKSVVGKVSIEGAHHPVAIAPRVGQGLVTKAAISLAVAGHVQPVARPAFAVVFGGQERVYDFREGVRTSIVQERRDLLGRGRQTN